jgi:uncharacterized protein involved in exopolysaccharide biosynthesis
MHDPIFVGMDVHKATISIAVALGSDLSSAKAGLTALQSRLTSGSTDLSNDPSDPDLQMLSGLKEKLSSAEAELAAAKGALGTNNPKMMAQQANMATVRKQMSDATERMRQHLKDRIGLTQTQIASLEGEQDQAQKSLIDIQAQRDRLAQLQRNVDFRAEQVNARERAAEQAKLKSKLTFSDMTVLDKAFPPSAPAFPKPFIVMPVGIAAGLALGLILTFSPKRRIGGFAFRSIWSMRPPALSWALSAARDARSRELTRHAAAFDPSERIGHGRINGRFWAAAGQPQRPGTVRKTIGPRALPIDG